jgi:hypothetical protein
MSRNVAGVTLYVDNGLHAMGMALDSAAMVRYPTIKKSARHVLYRRPLISFLLASCRIEKTASNLGHAGIQKYLLWNTHEIQKAKENISEFGIKSVSSTGLQIPDDSGFHRHTCSGKKPCTLVLTELLL